MENRYIQQQPYAAQVIVVLGGGSVGSAPDGTERGGLMSAGAARLLTAARLAKQHSLPVLISGGQVFITCCENDRLDTLLKGRVFHIRGGEVL